jgi:uncharacterized protein (UPF0276 family)
MTIVTISINNLNEYALYESALAKAKLDPPFVEILWDNFCHLDASALAEQVQAFAPRVALHIMWSRFLELDDQDWRRYRERLAAHVDALSPLYVSDHLCRFKHNDIHLGIPLEWDNTDPALVRKRVEQYQDAIGMPLLLENYASTEPHGRHQVEFLLSLRAQTGAGILFDISNARVAAKNGIRVFDDWVTALRNYPDLRCHVGSFAYDPSTALFHDTHDRDIGEETEADLENLLRSVSVASICYERDHDKRVEAMVCDIKRLSSRCLVLSTSA